MSPYKSARGGQCYTENYTVHSLLSMFFLFLFSFSLILVSDPLFYENHLFLIYSLPLHPNLLSLPPPFLFMTLVPLNI